MPEQNPEEFELVENPEKPEKESNAALAVELIKVIFWALVIIIPIRTFLFQPFFVQGQSMEPNFYNGEYLIINELGYKETKIGYGEKVLFTVDHYKDLQRGDVVVFRYPKDPNQYFIKRVVGLPGEKIQLRDNKITIFNKENPSGFTLEEDYLSNTTPTTGDEIVTLRDDEYWVLGDNRTHSSDSRSWGPVPQEDVIGKVLLRAWPIGEFKIF